MFWLYLSNSVHLNSNVRESYSCDAWEEDFFYNFHYPNRQYEDRYKAAYLAQQSTLCYGTLVQICTALAATAIMGMLIAKSK